MAFICIRGLKSDVIAYISFGYIDNLLLEFLGEYSIYNNIESKIYIEKQEQLPINHVFLSPEHANPNDCFKQLSMYNVVLFGR
jgi:hypothetical protein